MIYVDTNVLLSIFCPDALTEAAFLWYRKADAPVALSTWTATEFRANIGIRVRRTDLSRAAGLAAMHRFDAAIVANMRVLAPSAEHFDIANEWLANPDCALRSGDALHLAIATERRCSQLVTFDRSFGSAARKLKLPVVVLKPSANLTARR